MPRGRKPVHPENERMGQNTVSRGTGSEGFGGREGDPRVGWKGYPGRLNQSGPWEDEKNVA